MADELDPRLETRLRDTLRHEADTLPFTLTLADVEAARRTRRSRGARLRVPATLLASAAAVVIVVTGLVAWRSAAPPPTGAASPNPLAAGLQSYEQLEKLLPEAERGLFLLARAEHLAGAPADPATGETVITGIPAYSSLDVVVDCRGGAVRVWVRTGMQIGLPGPVACTGQPFTYRDAAGSGFAEAEIVVEAEPGVVWRLIAGGAPPTPTPRPTVVAPTGVASFEELAAVALSTRVVARAEGSAEPSDAVIEIARLGDLWNLEIALACTGPGSIEITSTGTSDSESTSTFGCGGGPGSMLVTALDTAAERAPDAALVATVPAGTAWRTIVFDHSAEVRPLPKAPAETFPMTDVGEYGGLVLGGEAPAEVATSRPVPGGATIEVAMSCTGDPAALVHIVLDGVATDLACLQGNVWHAVPDGDGTSVLEVSADDTVWVDIAVRAFTQEQAGAMVVVPSATLASVDGASSAPGFTTCLNAFEIQGGASADESCVPAPYVIPEARALRVRTGDSLELLGGSDWAITGATITYVPSSAAGNATPGDPAGHPDPGGPGVEGGFSVEPLPEGDWTLTVVVTGTLADGTTFTAQQLFRVIVGSG